MWDVGKELSGEQYEKIQQDLRGKLQFLFKKKYILDLCHTSNISNPLTKPGADGATATEAIQALDNLMAAITSLKWPCALSSVSLTICCVCPVLYVAASFRFTAQLFTLLFFLFVYNLGLLFVLSLKWNYGISIRRWKKAI